MMDAAEKMEKALEQALHTQFRFATHLCCFLHFQGNVESKLAELGISKPNAPANKYKARILAASSK